MADAPITQQATPPFDDGLIDQMLALPEGYKFDCKRLGGKLTSILETVVAFANSDGGIIALGFEDPDKAAGRKRVYGIDENPMNWDELRRHIGSRITEPHLLPYRAVQIGCTLHNGARGTLVFLSVSKSSRVHSIVDDGTFVRLDKSNKHLTAPEINDLCFARGMISAESQLEQVDLALLDTDYWRQYALHRRLTRPCAEAMEHLGLAKRDNNRQLRPTRAAVLLFAEEPSGLLGSKAAIRVFHYRGASIQTDPNTNLAKPPRTISGPLIRQIQDAVDVVVNELASGIQMGPLGFEVVQRYPLRVLKEAITNAVIHRDYRLPADIQVRIFADRIEIESPGLFAGPVTADNISRIGTYARNPLITTHLREFPAPPNLDAGEGVRMMFGTMRASGLYPPLYSTNKPQIEREAVRVDLRNENRPSIWEQVSDFVDKHGFIRNQEVRKLLPSEDVLRASKLLKEWVDKGLLAVMNPDEGTRVRRYGKPTVPTSDRLFSKLEGKESAG